MSPEEVYVFTVSPTDATDTHVTSALIRFASAFVHDGVVGGELALSKHDITCPSTEAELKSLEALHRVCDLYIWY